MARKKPILICPKCGSAAVALDEGGRLARCLRCSQSGPVVRFRSHAIRPEGIGIDPAPSARKPTLDDGLE